MNRKGQAAMEFLMTYGWAILVVLVVIGALAYFGVLSPTALLPEKCFLPIGLNCEQHRLTTSNANFEVRNGMGDRITIVNFTVMNDLGQVACKPTGSVLNGALQGATATTGAIECSNEQADCQAANGESVTISLTGCSNVGVAGDKSKYALNVVYFKGSDQSFAHTVEGELLTRIE